VVSLKNTFQKTNGKENGDLDIINSSEFVHVLTLKTFASGVF
jgi:hypothetical protein